ncbi:MAG: peptide chain release factor N(5)-glutamine methyltransferase [Hydrogenophilales bacterium]|nr:peptide chain release factor N(5)-glutamine methyltransferase [Hydrogenophilales bacterium]
MRLDALLADAARRLAETSPTPRLDARLLARHALGVSETWLIAHGRDAIEAEQATRIEALIDRRAAGEPVAYILGAREFYARVFKVTPDTLIPRPETEHLIEAALECLANRPALCVLDIGTGTGCIAITLKLVRPEWTVTAVDLSPATLAVARENGAALGAEVAWLESDLFAALGGQRFDLIVSNPPYVASADPHLTQGDLRFEPATALASGPDGLDTLRAIVKSAPTYLEPPGWLILEHGYDQADAVGSLLRDAGFKDSFLIRDLAGQARVSGGRLDACPEA